MVEVREVLTMVLAGGKGERLYPLTEERAKPAVPFGGMYRIIDFTLSNAVNSGLDQIVVLTQYRSYSLQRHIQVGWNFLARTLGRFIDAMPPQQLMGEQWYKGTADAIYQNSYYIHRFNSRDVLILSGDHIYKMDYGKFIRFHRKQEADATLSVMEIPKAEAKGLGIVVVDENYRIVEFQEKPDNPHEIPGRPGWCLANMGVYVFKRPELLDRLSEDADDTGSSNDFGKNILPGMVARGDNVYAYLFQDEKGNPGYWRDVGTIDAYHEAQMDLAAVTPRFNLYDLEWPIRTYALPLPPAKFVHAQDDGRKGMAVNSVICSGAIISGGYVERCVVSPWARVNSYAKVENSVIFERVNIGRHCKIKNCIIDKDVDVPEGTTIGHDLAADRQKYHVSPGGIVCLGKKRGVLRIPAGFTGEW
ncbi:MAG: glucose-1-phosphate adenylyltransferase [Planctomycetes bacterium]|nr:glucose-1-phosphate adenylyltransferase [Planctomycetota bacterium]